MSEVKAKVRFFGNDIGFQFSHTCNGSSSRIGRITRIHKPTEEDLEHLKDALRSDYTAHHGHRSRGKHRTVSWDWTDSKYFTLWVGQSYWRFRGEDPRFCKVACVQYKNTPLEQCRWESFNPIYEDEGEEA